MKESHNRLLSPAELARRLSVSRWTIYSWVRSGRLRAVRIGKLVRIPENELERLIIHGETKLEE